MAIISLVDLVALIARSVWSEIELCLGQRGKNILIHGQIHVVVLNDWG
jgi:hypothetical protein